MVAPSLRVPLVADTTRAGAGASVSPPLTIDLTAVAGDIAFLTATFTAGVDTASPATHDPAVLTLPGWTPSPQIQSTNDTSTTRTFTKTLVSADIGSQVSASSSVAGRVGAVLGVVKGAASVSVVTSAIQMASTTFAVPGFTPPANETLAIATAGLRWASTVTAPAVPAVTGWTELVDTATTNTTGQKASIWAASRTPSGTTPVAAASATAADGPTSGVAVLLFTPATSTVTASAGAARTVEAYTAVTLTGTTAGGTGSLTAQTWTQTAGPAVTLTPVSGDPASVTFTSPGTLKGATLTFRYAVTDSNGTTANASVTVTVVRARRQVNEGGVLKPIPPFVPPPVHPPVPATKLASPFYGGGGQSAFAWSPFSTSKSAIGSDTGGVRTSDDGTRTSSLALIGLDGLRAKQANGLAFSTVTDGVLFMTCGDSTAGTGGVYVRTGVFGTSPTAWTRLDGVLSGTPQLTFNGGNWSQSTTPGCPVEPNAKGTALVPATYPRQYNGALLRDDTTLPGKTILVTGTATDGAWRFVLDTATMAPLEQVRVPGTAGKLVRCLAWGSKDHSRVVVGLYDSGTPQTPVMLTNATAPVGTTLTTTTMTGSPKNLENVYLLPAPAAGLTSLAVAVTGKHDLTSQSGSVWLSTNLDAAAPASVSWTDCAKPYGSGASTAPENDEWWFACGGTSRQVGGVWQHRIFVGTSGGRRTTVGGVQKWNTVWVGTVAASSTTPATSMTWKVPTFTEQVLGLPGAAWKWWNSGVNTPTLNGTGAVSGFVVHPSDPNLVAVIAKGNTFLSPDGLDTANPSATGGTSDHNAAWWNTTTNPLRLLTTTGDWPLAASLDKPPGKTFDVQPNAVLQVAQAAGQGGDVDPLTGEVFVMVKTTGGGHDVPAADPNNALLSYSDAGMDNSVVDLSGAKNWGLSKDTTVTVGGASIPAATAIMTMRVVYGPQPSSGSRKGAIIFGRQNGKGMWFRSTDLVTTGETRVVAPSGANPFTSNPAAVYDLFDSAKDNTRSIAFFLERGNGVVWRVNVDQAGVATAVRLFQQGWAYSVSEGVGFIDYDRVADILWVSTKTGVYYLTGASTAAHVAGTADTVGAFTAVPWSTYYPGEIPGPMRWSAATSSLWVHTQHFATASSSVYPANGSNGPRSLLVANPTTPGSWARSVVNDLAISRDPQLRTGLVYPKGCSRNVDGSVITIQQQGSGLYVLRLA